MKCCEFVLSSGHENTVEFVDRRCSFSGLVDIVQKCSNIRIMWLGESKHVDDVSAFVAETTAVGLEAPGTGGAGGHDHAQLLAHDTGALRRAECLQF